MGLDLKRYAPTFSLIIGGNPQPDLEKSVISLEVDESLDSPGMFTFNINEGLDAKTQKFKWLDNKLLDPGSKEEVKIYLGYAGSPVKPNEPLITGKIIALNPSFPSNGIPSLSVQGYDHAFCLQKLQKSPDPNQKTSQGTFKNAKSYQEVARMVASKRNLGTDIKGDLQIREIVIQDSCESDYSFLKRLADRIGYEFFVRNKVLYFREPKDDEDAALTLTWGKEIISFSPRMSAAKVVSKVTVRGHSVKDHTKPIVGVATSSDLGFNEPGARSGAEFIRICQDQETESVTSDLPVSSEDDAKNLAVALLQRANNSLIEGTIECIGMSEIRPGINIGIEGIGQRFSGRYYVKSVKHTLGDGGYTMSFDVRRGGVGAE